MLAIDRNPVASPESELPPYERHAGLHVLRLAGDDYEMGYRHGVLLREAIQRGPLVYFERFVERMLAVDLGPRAAALLAAAIRATVGKKIAAGFPPHARAALEGLAEGSGIDRKRLLGAVTMPESFLWCLQRLLDLRRPGLAPRHGVPLMGCTSVVAFGDATRDRKLLHGRNFDYQGVGFWDTEQAVVFHRPKVGQPYVSIAAAGILFGGITAMNASGLTLVVHQHMGSRALRLGGTPIGITGDWIMRHASDLDEARRILDEDKPNGCWTYIIGSARDRAVLCYELTPAGRRAFRVDDGTFGYSNVFLDPELGASEQHIYPTHWRNNLARLRRARQLLAERRGDHDADTIASILGDHGDPGCRFETAIAMLQTVASVVFQPDDGIVYVATGRAPVSNRDYVAFDLKREAPRPDLPKLSGGQRDARATEAFDAYRRAYEAYFERADLATAQRELAAAIELAPNEAVYHFVLGAISLLAGQAGSAERELGAAVSLGHASPERAATFTLWRARARDVLGRRSDALSDYASARQTTDASIRRAADSGLAKPWKRRRFGIELSYGDIPMP